MKKSNLIFIILCSIFHFNYAQFQQPKITVIFIVDQLAYRYLERLKPFFTGGFKQLLNRGVNYLHTTMPNAVPETAPGHACIATGTYAQYHGIVRNSWFENGKQIACDNDSSESSAVFSPDGTYDYGKSAHYLMVDTLSDQFVSHSSPAKKYHAFSISLKSRAAIMTAGKLGKAIWFDKKAGLLTSSKYYFDELPSWLKTFNSTQINDLQKKCWHLLYPKTSKAYAIVNPLSYQYAGHMFSLIDYPIFSQTALDSQNPFDLFIQTPFANQLLLDLALSCIATFAHKESNNHLLLWVCLSPLDFAGHSYGPESFEAIDMLYHLDCQLDSFMSAIQKYDDEKNMLFVLTADHGIGPIIELLQKKGYPQARRIDAKKFLENINSYLENKFQTTQLISYFDPMQLYINSTLWNSFTKQKQQTIADELKKYLKKQPGIKNAWTFDELVSSCTTPDPFKKLFTMQLFAQRSGSFIMQTFPYISITPYKTGTSHESPYDYDTHIPCILYQAGAKPKKIRKKVSILQLAPTLASILEVERPSASAANVLPGI